MPTTVMSVYQSQKVLKVLLPLMLTSEKQSLSGSKVHRAEDDTTSVPARDEHTGWLAASAPVRAQRRKQQQIGLVFRQKHTSTWQVPDSAANSPFFSRAPDRVLRRIAVVSTRNLVVSTHGVSCRQKTSCPCTFPTGLEAGERTSSQQSNRVPQESVSGSLVTTVSIPRSKKTVVPNVLHHAKIQGPKIPCSVQSSGRCSADSHTTSVRSPSQTALDGIPKPRVFVDTDEHPANSSIAFPAADAVEMTNAVSSWKRPRLPALEICPETECNKTFAYLLR